jgi:hypothetical protein
MRDEEKKRLEVGAERERERERERSGWGKATLQHTLHSIPPLLLSLRVTLFPTLSSLTRTYSLYHPVPSPLLSSVQLLHSYAVSNPLALLLPTHRPVAAG